MSFGPKRAEYIATRAHHGHVRKDGEPFIEHLRRVADACDSAQAQAVAWLHDTIEDVPHHVAPDTWPAVVRTAVELLTHDSQQRTYRVYIERIATAEGAAGELAREVKRADLVDNLAHLTPEFASLQKRYEMASERLAS